MSPLDITDRSQQPDRPHTAPESGTLSSAQQTEADMFGAYKSPADGKAVCHRCLPSKDSPRERIVILYSWDVHCAGCGERIYSEDDRYDAPRKTLADYPKA